MSIVETINSAYDTGICEDGNRYVFPTPVERYRVLVNESVSLRFQKSPDRQLASHLTDAQHIDSFLALDGRFDCDTRHVQLMTQFDVETFGNNKCNIFSGILSMGLSECAKGHCFCESSIYAMDRRLTQQDKITSLSALHTLTSVHSLLVCFQPQLRNFQGLQGITHIEVFQVAESDALESFTGLDNLRHIGNFTINENCPGAKEQQHCNDCFRHAFIGLRALLSVNEIQINSNRCLRSLEGLESLNRVGNITIWGNFELKNANLNPHVAFSGNVDVDDYNVGRKCRWPLVTLHTQIDVHFFGQQKCKVFRGMLGLGDFSCYYGYFALEHGMERCKCDQLDVFDTNLRKPNEITDLSALHTLTSVESLLICSQLRLRNFQGLQEIKRIGLFHVFNNVGLSFHGLDNLVQIDQFHIDNNCGGYYYTCSDCLQHAFHGLRRLSSVNELIVNGNTCLESLGGLGSLRSIGNVSIYRNRDLRNFSGLNPDVTVSGNVIAYENFHAFEQKGPQQCEFGRVGILGWSPCNQCRPGKFSDVRGARVCRICESGKVAEDYGSSDCHACEFPQIASHDRMDCINWFLSGSSIWFHAFLAIVLVLIVASLVRRSKARKNNLETTLLAEVKRAVAVGDGETLMKLENKLLVKCKWSASDVTEFVRLEEKEQSESGGISVGYLISHSFAMLAQEKAGIAAPSFYDLSGPFFSGSDALGKHVVCPRDGRDGCALIDYLPRRYRGTCTHFLSWTWGYKVSLVKESLEGWVRAHGMKESEVFLYCCFFCNNQYRILHEKGGQGSENLENVFEQRLLNIGSILALLDGWQRPRYLTRIWTIYEQFTAAKLAINVEMILPPAAHESLISTLEGGKHGIEEVSMALTEIDSQNAEAYSEKDKEKVKAMIRQTIGFDEVNYAVASSMSQWVGSAVHHHFKNIVSNSLASQSKCIRTATEIPFRREVTSIFSSIGQSVEIELSDRRQPSVINR